MLNLKPKYPENIICLTEESVETLFLIGKGGLIKGVSCFVKRPAAALALPKVSQFTNSNIDKIIKLNPDLVLGFSDIQKDIARDLIAKGINVWISNHRSIGEILNYILILTSMIGEQKAGEELCQKLIDKIRKVKELSKQLQFTPRVYFEEWDDPKISAIKWVSELIAVAGGVDIFIDKSNGSLAADRFVSDEEIIAKNPDVILGCWCGKKVNIKSIYERENYHKINAIRNNQVFEVEPEIFLQPGPAPILEGLDILYKIFTKLQASAT